MKSSGSIVIIAICSCKHEGDEEDRGMQQKRFGHRSRAALQEQQTFTGQ
jgi:hypothetical protein